MPADLFRSAPPRPASRARAWLVPASIAVHVAVILAFVIAPLLADVRWPQPARPGGLEYVRVELPRAPRVPLAEPVRATAAAHSDSRSAPLEAPPRIAPERLPDFRAPDDGLEERFAGFGKGVPFGDPIGIELPPAPPREPLHVGGHVEAPRKVTDVRPVYPPIALRARVEGIVILEAVIGADGRVERVRVLRSVPLLDQAAVDAVQQWVFQPTRLNGEAIPVVMTVTVDFRLR